MPVACKHASSTSRASYRYSRTQAVLCKHAMLPQPAEAPAQNPDLSNFTCLKISVKIRVKGFMHAMLQPTICVSLLLHIRLSLKCTIEVSAVQSVRHLQGCSAASGHAMPAPG